MARAANGAWYLPASSPPYSYMLLCAEHGTEAERRGAKPMSWRPRKTEPAMDAGADGAVVKGR